MKPMIDAKAATRNSMLEKLQSKFQKKNIQVQAYENDEMDDEGEVGHTFIEPKEMAPAQASVLDSYLEQSPLFAVAEVDDSLIGGTLATVMGEIEKLKPSKVEFKIISTDERAAKAAMKEPEQQETVAAPQTDEVGQFYVVTHASPVSELHDICFQADIQNIILQARGGLKEEDIIGVYKNKDSAVAKARELLKEMNSPHVDQDASVVEGETAVAVAGPHDSKIMALLTAIRNHASNAEGEIASAAVIAEEYDKYLQENGVEELGLVGSNLDTLAQEVKDYTKATKDSAEKILGIV